MHGFWFLAKESSHMFVDEGLLHGHRRQYKTNPKTGDQVALPCPRGDECSLVVETLQEAQFLSALGVPWIEPCNRSLEALARAAGSSEERHT
jgi:hypothetical protein